MKISYKLIILLLTWILFPKDSSIDINKQVIFNELDVDFVNDPYKNFLQQWDPKHRRFYSLVHETIYEPITESSSLPTNFTLDENIVYSVKNLPEGVKSQIVITLLDKHEAQWYFQNTGEAISSKDIAYSIKYAICAQLIPDKHIQFSDVTYDLKQNIVTISSKVKLPYDMYKSYLKNIYILSSSCFSQYIDLGCKVIEDSFNEQYGEILCIEEFNDEPINYMNSAGPYTITEILPNQRVVMNQNKKYYKPVLADGFVCKANSLKATYFSEFAADLTNLAIDIPKSSAGNTIAAFADWNKLETYSAKLLFINYEGKASKHLLNKDFRKAINYAVNRKEIVRSRFAHDAIELTGPISNISEFYNSAIDFEKDMKGDALKISNQDDPDCYFDETFNYGPKSSDNLRLAKCILKSAGYKIEKKRNKKILKDSNGEVVSLTIAFYNRIPKTEQDAVQTTIPSYLKDLGIKINLKAINSKTDFNNIKKLPKYSHKWDLCYDEIIIKDPMNLMNYFGPTVTRLNYGKYRNSLLDEQFMDLRSVGSDGVKKVVLGQRIHGTLYDDIASIFLWRNHTHYVYNRTKIDESIENMVDSEHFFITPHNWKMIE